MSKDDERDARRALQKKVKGVIGWAIGIAVVGGIIYVVVTAPRLPPSEFVATAGIHWHPHLVIKVNGVSMPIPKGIGLTGVSESPIHTHEEDGIIHLEFSGMVKKDDIHLQKFFTVWGKEWTPTSFMGNPIGNGHTLTMMVDGASSTEYGNLMMKDKQEIELDYQ